MNKTNSAAPFKAEALSDNQVLRLRKMARDGAPVEEAMTLVGYTGNVHNFKGILRYHFRINWPNSRVSAHLGNSSLSHPR